MTSQALNRQSLGRDLQRTRNLSDQSIVHSQHEQRLRVPLYRMFEYRVFEYRVSVYRVSEYRVLRRITGPKTEKVGGENSSARYSNMSQQDARVTEFILSDDCSTCFGYHYHPSSEAQNNCNYSIW